MKDKTILTVPVHFEGENTILEKTKKFLNDSHGFFHIVSLNPEILVSSTHNEEFRKVLSEGDAQICDGIGTLLGCSILGIPTHGRLSGVDLMERIVQTFNGSGLHVLLIGAQDDLAKNLADCYKRTYPGLEFEGMQGYRDINSPNKAEEGHIAEIIKNYKPRIIFAAFGSPAQEMWLDRHKSLFEGAVCMGVGGGFNLLTGKISRAPVFMRRIGLEWLYRLWQEPWRWRRQLKLFEFMYLVVKQRVVGSV